MVAVAVVAVAVLGAWAPLVASEGVEVGVEGPTPGSPGLVGASPLRPVPGAKNHSTAVTGAGAGAVALERALLLPVPTPTPTPTPTSTPLSPRLSWLPSTPSSTSSVKSRS
jgi:hypothetical protein